MRVIEVNGAPQPSDEPLVLAIGKFDGIHIGHQAILGEAKTHLVGSRLVHVDEPGGMARLGVMSFSPHPAWVLGRKSGYDRLLTPREEQQRLLSAHGVQDLYNVHFSREYASTTAEAFVHEHLPALSVKRVVCGFDFRFGRGGTADVEALKSLAGQVGIPVSVVEPVELNGIKVSSSSIREHLANGRVEAVDALLGRPYAITGTVVQGNKLGRTIGFPTANLGALDEYVMPSAGVYAVSVEILDSRHEAAKNWFGVMNAGYRPTVNGDSFRVEVHLLGFEGNLYNQQLRVSLLRRVRDEQKFPNVEALQGQIAKDIEYARHMLGMHG